MFSNKSTCSATGPALKTALQQLMYEQLQTAIDKCYHHNKVMRENMLSFEQPQLNTKEHVTAHRQLQIHHTNVARQAPVQMDAVADVLLTLWPAAAAFHCSIDYQQWLAPLYNRFTIHGRA